MTDLSKIRRRGFGKPPTEASENLAAPEVAPAAPERPDGPPWAGANPRMKVQFTLRLPERVHLALSHLASVSPESMHEIAVLGVETEIRKRLAALGVEF
jgi:hypothetical protein